MAMGIVSEKEFDSELNSLNTNKDKSQREESNSTPTNITNSVEIKDMNKGRGVGNVEVPNALRNLIGQATITGGRQEAVELAKHFGISPSSTSAYAKGANSTSSYEDRPNAGIISNAKQRVSRKARAKLILALNKLSESKLDDAKARDLAGIAKDMSVVMRNMDDNTNSNPDSSAKAGPTFVFYSPQIRKEETFDAVFAKE